MRIMNREHADADLHNFLVGHTEDPSLPEILYEAWLQKVWLPHVLKTDPGLAFQVQVKDASSMFASGAPEPALYVDLPRQGQLRLHKLSEWDVKDAQRGLLYYYEPTMTTLASYRQGLTSIRDYLMMDVFATKEGGYDVRKHTVQTVQVGAEKWHAEMLAKLERERQERAKQARAISIKPSHDIMKVIEFTKNGKEYELHRLLTQAALTHESDVMHHCVYSYGLRIVDGVTVLLSVREKDAPMKPIITLEVAVTAAQLISAMPLNFSNMIVQVRGPYNGEANLVIPGFVEVLPRLLSAIERKALAPIQQSLTFKV